MKDISNDLKVVKELSSELETRLSEFFDPLDIEFAGEWAFEYAMQEIAIEKLDPKNIELLGTARRYSVLKEIYRQALKKPREEILTLELTNYNRIPELIKINKVVNKPVYLNK